MFKLTHGLISTSLINALNYAKCDSTRGHSNKLFINRCNKSVLSNFFINRIAPVWNFLPSDCFSRDSLFHFKKSIKKVDFSRFMLYD